jgi:2C-methyl-D-erythritol 2,4-cyclodiphosphate synthase
MKYFVQVKFREFQMTSKKLRILNFFIVIIFQTLHFGPQIFKLTPLISKILQIDLSNFPKL